jgi:hypothetical protein
MTTTTLDDARAARDSGSSLYLAFLPWVVFAIVAHRDTFLAGALVALAAACGVAWHSTRDGRSLKAPEVGAVVAFAGFAVVALVIDQATADELARYARAIAAGLLALIAFGSLLGTPFTEQYARESVPRELWSSPRFRAINRDLTSMWGLVFLLMVPAHALAGAIDTPHANLFLNWVVPILLITWAARRTQRVTGETNGGVPA